MTERLYLQRRQQKSSAHGVHNRDWRTGFKWLKYYLIALEEKEKDQEDVSACTGMCVILVPL